MTDIVHDDPAVMLAPLIASVDPPASADAVPAAHVVVALGTDATTTPLGNVSVNAAPVTFTAPAPVLLIVTVSVDVAPALMLVGENALLIVTGGATVSVADAGELLVAPCVVESAPAGIVLVYEPASLR